MQDKSQDIPEISNTMLDLLATVSHELRSPLTAIQGYTFTLLRHAEHISQEEQREFLMAIHDASKHLESLISHILELSQLETGTIKLEPSTVNVVSLMHEVIAAHTANTGFHPLILSAESDHPHQDTLSVVADHRRLREIVDLLLENAQAFSSPGENIEIGVHRLTLNEHEHEQAVIELWVRDYGIGIPVQQLEPIFRQFHRLDTNLTREINGLGLGLTICKHLVELHNGTIRVESEIGKGSTFYVQLPEYPVGA